MQSIPFFGAAFRSDLKDMFVYAGKQGLDDDAILKVPTLYQQAQEYGMESVVAANMISRGAEHTSYGVIVKALMGLNLLGPAAISQMNEEASSLHHFEYLSDFVGTVDEVLQTGGFGVTHGRPFGMLYDFGAVNGLSHFALQREIPDIMTCYLAGTDATVHGEGTAHGNDFTWKYSDSAFWILYKILQMRGYDTSTLFVIVSDHGLSDVNQQGFIDPVGSNDLPEFSVHSLPSARLNEPWSCEFSVADADGDAVSLSMGTITTPPGVELEEGMYPNFYTLSWTPDTRGEHVISVVADDGQGAGLRKLTISLSLDLAFPNPPLPTYAQTEIGERALYDQSVVALYDEDGLEDDIGPALNELNLTVWGYSSGDPEYVVGEEFERNLTMDVRSVYSPNGGMGHIYLRKAGDDDLWGLQSSLDTSENQRVASWFAERNATPGDGFYQRFAAVLYRSEASWGAGGGGYTWANWIPGDPGMLVPVPLDEMSDQPEFADWDMHARLTELAGPRSGDIILVMGESGPSRAKNRHLAWHWEAEQFKGFHGEPDPTSSKVPLVFAFPGGNTEFISSAINDPDRGRVSLLSDDFTNADLTPILMMIIESLREKKPQAATGN